MDDIPSYLKHYMISNDYTSLEDRKRYSDNTGGSMSPTLAYNWLQMAKTIENTNDSNLNKMFKRHIKSNIDADQEYNEVYKAFTYGL